MNKETLKKRAVALFVRVDQEWRAINSSASRQPGWADEINRRLLANRQRQEAARQIWEKAQ